ncbi:hypothetical protein KBC03_02665 [Patescibacteria group bacterium]|nr:hypothetical protein [Patescibacteria group bacterium]
MTRLQRTLIIGLKIFFLGLILHFFIYNFVTYVLHLTGPVMDVIRLWKEILTILFFIALTYYVLRYRELKIFKQDKALRRLLRTFIALLLITFIITLLK